MSNLVDLWGLRWVETPKGLDCLDLAGTNARLVHLDDWQFTFEVYSPTRGATPLEALEARLGPPIQVLGVTYYPMPQVDSFKQYLPDPSGNNI